MTKEQLKKNLQGIADGTFTAGDEVIKAVFAQALILLLDNADKPRGLTPSESEAYAHYSGEIEEMGG